MGTEQDEAAAQSLAELLAIARVSMPDFLYKIDPRVHRARQLLARLAQVSGHRPPSIIPTSEELMVDLAPPPTFAEVEHMPSVEPPWDITAGLDAFMASDLAPESRMEAMVLILREWLTTHGYIALPPADEERH